MNAGIFKNPLSFTWYTLQVLFEVRVAPISCTGVYALISILVQSLALIVSCWVLGEVSLQTCHAPLRPAPHQPVRCAQIGCDVVMEDCGEIVTCKGCGSACGSGRKKDKGEDKPSKKKDKKEKKSGGWFGGGRDDEDDE